MADLLHKSHTLILPPVPPTSRYYITIIHRKNHEHPLIEQSGIFNTYINDFQSGAILYPFLFLKEAITLESVMDVRHSVFLRSIWIAEFPHATIHSLRNIE